MEHVFKNTKPLPTDGAPILDATACPGEQEPIVFSLHALADLKQVAVTVAKPLTDPNGHALPKTAIEILPIRCLDKKTTYPSKDYYCDLPVLLERRAASVLQPDLSHAGGIFECRLIAGMAEAYYAAIAPHCPLGPVALAACIQLDATIPNFLCQESVTLGKGYLKTPFVVKDGYVDLPAAPGLGIELDEEAMADKIGHDWRNPETYDPDDGTPIDW